MTYDNMNFHEPIQAFKDSQNAPVNYRAINADLRKEIRRCLNKGAISRAIARRAKYISRSNRRDQAIMSDVRSGWNAVSSEWWRNGMAIGAPTIDSPDRKRHLASLQEC